MIDLTLESLTELKNRFGTFHDGIVDDIHIDHSNWGAPMKLTVPVMAHENPLPRASVTFEMSDVIALIIRQPRNYALGVIFDLDIDIFDGEIYFDFLGWGGVRNREDYEVKLTTAPGRGSAFMVVCGKCSYSIAPYVPKHPGQ